MNYFLLAVISLSFFAACDNSNKKKNADNAAGTPTIKSIDPPVTTLPSFSIISSNGGISDLTQFKGKRVFVNLWATWCPPCRVEIPSIQKLYAKTDKNKVSFVMLSLDNNFETAKQFATKTKLDIPIYYPAGKLPALFNVESIPVTFIFDENGILIHRQEGTADYNTNQFVEMLNK